MMFHLFAILGLAALCGAWVLVQRGSGRDLHICSGAATPCRPSHSRPGRCQGCPRESE